MTVFFEVARIIAHDIVSKAIEASHEADGATRTRLIGMAGRPRNLALSDAKRVLMDDLLIKIDGLMAGQDEFKDQSMLAKFRALIMQCIDDATAKAQSHREGTGNTEVVLGNLLIVLDATYKKLNELALLDLPRDKDPLNIFCYYVALYFAKNKVANSDHGAWRLVSFPFSGKKVDFNVKQEALLVNTFKECRDHVLGLNECVSEDKRQQEHYLSLRKQIIVLYLFRLTTENNGICAQFVSALYDPNDGNLVECLKLAQDELHAKPAIQVLPEKKSSTSPISIGSSSNKDSGVLDAEVVAEYNSFPSQTSGDLAFEPQSPRAEVSKEPLTALDVSATETRVTTPPLSLVATYGTFATDRTNVAPDLDSAHASEAASDASVNEHVRASSPVSLFGARKVTPALDVTPTPSTKKKKK